MTWSERCTSSPAGAIDHAVSLDGLQVTRPSLEDIYLSLTEAPPTHSGSSTGTGEGSL